tara:strand:+ start:12507 stop:13178 length:672 start_codon:yes stop_codon:yes gene_type:complete
MNTGNPNDTRLIYDQCSYEEKLKRSIGPGLYTLNVPNNDCTDCGKDIPPDPALRYQQYNKNLCNITDSVDDSNELKGLNYKNSKCNEDSYIPNTYEKKSKCSLPGNTNPRDCFTPQESTRLSNPSNTLRCTGINRWQWLHCNPQDYALETFDRIPVNYRMLAKDNHVPLIEKPLENTVEPDSKNLDIDPSSTIDNWAKGNATHSFAPGNPAGVVNYNLACYGN